jgi:ParB/RepB/Spo0J family partition protein
VDDDDYELIAGERRWRAAQRAGLQELPCRVLRGLADVDAFILSVTENVARRDLNPIEEAASYQRIVACGRTIDETAALFGKQPETVQYRVDLLGLREDVQALVARDRPHHQGLQEPELADAGGQLVQRVFVEKRARLGRVRVQLRDRNRRRLSWIHRLSPPSRSRM